MDVKAVYSNLESVVFTLVAAEAKQLFSELEGLVGGGQVSAGSVASQVHENLGAIPEVTQP